MSVLRFGNTSKTTSWLFSLFSPRICWAMYWFCKGKFDVDINSDVLGPKPLVNYRHTRAILFPETTIVLVSTKKLRPLGEIVRWASINYSGYSLYTCLETVIEIWTHAHNQSVEGSVTTDLKRAGCEDEIAYGNGKSPIMYAAFAVCGNFIAQEQSNGLLTQVAKLQATKIGAQGSGNWVLLVFRTDCRLDSWVRSTFLPECVCSGEERGLLTWTEAGNRT